MEGVKSGSPKGSAKEPGSTRAFYIVVIIVTGIIFGSLIANCVYFNKIKNDGGTSSVSKSNATIMVWFNALMAAAAGAIFVYAIIKLLIPPKYVMQAADYLSAEVHSGGGLTDSYWQQIGASGAAAQQAQKAK